MTFKVLASDPPWSFGDRLPGKGRGAAKHYNCMTVDELKSFALPDMADDSVLLMWRVAAMQQEALDVVRSWGYVVKSEIVWRKLTKTGTKEHFGMGRHVRAAHEVCLVCTRGRPKAKSHSERSLFSAPVGRHSEKPSAFFSLVERLYDGPYVEIFARRHRPGWTCLGDQVSANESVAVGF